jgi:hypothetical protein
VLCSALDTCPSTTFNKINTRPGAAWHEAIATAAAELVRLRDAWLTVTNLVGERS